MKMARFKTPANPQRAVDRGCGLVRRHYLRHVSPSSFVGQAIYRRSTSVTEIELQSSDALQESRLNASGCQKVLSVENVLQLPL
jgi:hypothetical protein